MTQNDNVGKEAKSGELYKYNFSDRDESGISVQTQRKFLCQHSDQTQAHASTMHTHAF